MLNTASGGQAARWVEMDLTEGRPIWFGSESRPLFGWWHGPDDGRARAGVVICPPLGYEYLQSHRALRLLAETLADRGFCAVRFDYDGTGDSAGDDSDAHRLQAWTSTIRSALALVRRHAHEQVVLVGMRFGATMAASVAAEDRRVDQLVLWDPCASGRSYLAEQRAMCPPSPESMVGSSDGSFYGIGVVYESETVTDIGRMDIASCAFPLARRVLVLTRRDRPSDTSIFGQFLASETLQHGEATGQLELMDHVPPAQRLPGAAVEGIVAWLSEGTGSRPRRVHPPDPAAPRVVGGDENGRPILETPVVVPPAGLFGILTEPVAREPTSSGPTAVLLNAGNQHHVGPARAWVRLARRWAATTGIRSLRVDLSGLGDSPFRQTAGPWTCNKAEAFDDVLDAARWASPDDPSNVVLVGLCSSGYQALESGLALGAHGVIAINPGISFVPAEHRAGLPGDPRRRILLPKDDVSPVFREGGSLSWFRDHCPAVAWRSRILLSPRRRSGRWLHELARRHVDTLIVCGDTEMRPIRQGITAGGLRRLQRTGLVRLEHLPGLEHALPIAAQRTLVLDMVSEHLESRFSSSTTGPDPRPPTLLGRDGDVVADQPAVASA